MQTSIACCEGGVTAAKGFMAGGSACGIKKKGALDLALIFAEAPAVAAGVFTKNRIKGHSLKLTQSRIGGGGIKAVAINSGNANACLGPQGDRDASGMAEIAALALGVRPEEVLVASTGVIGQRLDLALIDAGMANALAALGKDGTVAAKAIMTTDTFAKEAAVTCELPSGRTVRIGGMAKGSGMIHPNMATLLGFLTTDASVAPDALQQALYLATEVSFNAVSVDGDTSPCDSVILLANGMAGGPVISLDSPDFNLFLEALTRVTQTLAKMIALDGEGATKLIAISVRGADSADTARRIGRAVAVSPLVKTAFYGADANWGRILSAIGNAGAAFDPDTVAIKLGGALVCQNGCAVAFAEEETRRILESKEIAVQIELGSGPGEAMVWTCDLSPEYVRINGSYRS